MLAPYSLNLNAIETVSIKDWIDRHYGEKLDDNHLRFAVEEAWEVPANRVEDMPKRCKAVVEAEGNTIRRFEQHGYTEI